MISAVWLSWSKDQSMVYTEGMDVPISSEKGPLTTRIWWNSPQYRNYNLRTLCTKTDCQMKAFLPYDDRVEIWGHVCKSSTWEGIKGIPRREEIFFTVGPNFNPYNHRTTTYKTGVCKKSKIRILWVSERVTMIVMYSKGSNICCELGRASKSEYVIFTYYINHNLDFFGSVLTLRLWIGIASLLLILHWVTVGILNCPLRLGNNTY